MFIAKSVRILFALHQAFTLLQINPLLYIKHRLFLRQAFALCHVQLLVVVESRGSIDVRHQLY